MKKKLAIAASIIALFAAAPLFAQGALVGVDDLDDRIDDIQTDVADDLAEAEDSARFGPNQYSQGWTGSVSASLSATDGNTDSGELTLGGRLRYGNGPWNHTLGVAVEVGEENGNRYKEEAYATYDVNRYFNDQFYMFGLGSVKYDGFDTNEWDAFLGFGPGVRVINTPDIAWRLQAGPGVRYTEDQLGNDQTEVAGIASSRFFYKFNDVMFLTNDTDVVFSDSSTVAANDFGVNYKLTNALAARASYRTEWTSDPLPGLTDTDNTLGVSLVVGF